VGGTRHGGAAAQPSGLQLRGHEVGGRTVGSPSGAIVGAVRATQHGHINAADERPRTPRALGMHCLLRSPPTSLVHAFWLRYFPIDFLPRLELIYKPQKKSMEYPKFGSGFQANAVLAKLQEAFLMQ
jgi:hypothetical protein